MVQCYCKDEERDGLRIEVKCRRSFLILKKKNDKSIERKDVQNVYKYFTC